MDDMDDLFLNVSEAAKFLGVNPDTLRRWDNEGTLPAMKINDRGDRRWRKSDLLVFARDKKAPSALGYKGYEITLSEGGFQSFVDRFGVVGKYVIEQQDQITGCVFACAGLEIMARQLHGKKLRDLAVKKIKETIDNDGVMDEDVMTFEFRNGDFQRVYFPEWWGDQKSLMLVDGLRARLKAVHQVKEGSENWRCTVVFESKNKEGTWLTTGFGPQKNKMEYHVEVTAEYLEDHAHQTPTSNGAEIFALIHIKGRFDKTVDSSGDRSIEKIEESRAVCMEGKCVLVKSYQSSLET